MIVSNLRASAWKYTCLLFAVLAVAAVVYVFFLRASAASDRARADAAEQRAGQSEAQLQATREALERERAAAKRLFEIAEVYEQDKLNAQDTARRVADDLRADNVRLKRLWQAERATDRLSDAAAAARHADEVTQLRAEAAGRIIGIGAEMDAQVRALQRVIEADREVVR